MHILYGTSAVQRDRVMTSRTDHLYLKKNPILIKIMGAYRGCSVPLRIFITSQSMLPL